MKVDDLSESREKEQHDEYGNMNMQRTNFENTNVDTNFNKNVPADDITKLS